MRSPRVVAFVAAAVLPAAGAVAAHEVSDERYNGPILYVSSCAVPGGSPAMEVHIGGRHEPGEIHRYRWRLDIDGQAVVGGTVELSSYFFDPAHGNYVVPPHLYPVTLGAEYRLSAQDGFDPDRLKVTTEVVEDCAEEPNITVVERP